MTQSRLDINKLKEDDLITIILYCIYKFTGDTDFSTIAELAYTLDKDSLYKLCATFGGTTIKIPTMQEYKTMAKVMLVFEYVNSDGLTYVEACNKADVKYDDKDIIEMYNLMQEVLESYEWE